MGEQLPPEFPEDPGLPAEPPGLPAEPPGLLPEPSAHRCQATGTQSVAELALALVAVTFSHMSELSVEQDVPGFEQPMMQMHSLVCGKLMKYPSGQLVGALELQAWP